MPFFNQYETEATDPATDFENEQEEMLHANPPVDLTPELWVGYLLPFSSHKPN